MAKLVPYIYDIEKYALVKANPEEFHLSVYLKRDADKEFNRYKYYRCMGMVFHCRNTIDELINKSKFYSNTNCTEYIKLKKRISLFIKWEDKWRKLAKRVDLEKYKGIEPKWLYRLEATDENNGLWYNSRSEYVWGCRECKGEAKDLPMGYNERYHIDGKNWFSSCSRIEDLLHWYSKEDAKYLLNNGFKFYRYYAKDYYEFDLETVFLKESVKDEDKVEITFEELFGDE